MGFSFLHLILVVVVIAVLFGPRPFKRAGLGAGEFWRNLKRSYKGEEDIDITATVKPEQIKENEKVL